MNQNQISPDDPRLTLYALGEMEPHERAGFEKLLEQDAAARQVVAEIRGMATTVTAALEHEPAEVAAKPAGKVLRFPQAYFMISGLAAACFAVFFTVWQSNREMNKETQLIEVPLTPVAARESKDEKAAAADASVAVALPPAPAVATEAVPMVRIDLAQASPMPHTFPLQDSTRSASNMQGADVAWQRANVLNAQESRAREQAVSERQLAAAAEGLAGSRLKESQAPRVVATIEPNAVAFAEDPASVLVKRMEDDTIKLDAFSVSPSPAATKSKQMLGKTSGGMGAPPEQTAFYFSRAEADRNANTEAYAHVKDNGFLRTAENPLSTFSIDVDTASYANVRRFLHQKQRPPADAVRIEELVNYFPYEYALPAGNVPFAASLEVAGAPWMPDHRLVRIGLKGREISEAQRPPANLVFLIDVSGSMNKPNKLPLVKQSLRLLVNQLRADDRVAIAVYAGKSGLALPSTRAREKATILEAIDELSPGGSTNGAMGIHLAYDIAKANFVAGGVNRVILATDGDFNVGTTSEGELVRLIGEKAASGVFLSVLGFGMGNLKDSTLERLADKGNGNYAYIDSLAEAKKTLVEQAGGTLVTIAKDVKIQVEFNPAQVQAYRLVGYENRLLAKEDFNNDKVDAGEIGAGHTVTALYEVVPVGAAMPEDSPAVDGLKYQKTTQGAVSGEQGGLSKELLTVKIRYKEPAGDVSTKLEFPLVDAGTRFADASGDFKFAAAVAGFGMTLRKSPHKGQLTLTDVLEWGRAGLGQDVGGYRAEFLTLVEAADVLVR
jgi:Ca-activated chloride channel family protein